MLFPMIPGSSSGVRAQFFRELARLTGAGLSVQHAAKVLSGHRRHPATRQAVEHLERGLAAGQSIAGALGPSLTPMEAAVVDAAEQSGKLADGFHHLEVYYELLQKTVNRIKAALLYPGFMLHMAVILPAIVGAVLAKQNVVWSAILALGWLWAVLLVLGILGTLWARRAEVSPAADRLLTRLPVIGPARKTLALARWQTVLHFQITGGQRLSHGLELAGAATRSALLARASHAAARAVEEGRTLGDALAPQSAFPMDLTGNLAAAEFTGTLDTETLRLSRESMAAAGTDTERAAKLACGIAYGLIMCFTAWQILRLAGQYFSIYSNFLNSL